jgi:hypothetical protein
VWYVLRVGRAGDGHHGGHGEIVREHCSRSMGRGTTRR